MGEEKLTFPYSGEQLVVKGTEYVAEVTDCFLFCTGNVLNQYDFSKSMIILRVLNF